MHNKRCISNYCYCYYLTTHPLVNMASDGGATKSFTIYTAVILGVVVAICISVVVLVGILCFCRMHKGKSPMYVESLHDNGSVLNYCMDVRMINVWSWSHCALFCMNIYWFSHFVLHVPISACIPIARQM